MISGSNRVGKSEVLHELVLAPLKAQAVPIEFLSPKWQKGDRIVVCFQDG